MLHFFFPSSHPGPSSKNWTYSISLRSWTRGLYQFRPCCLGGRKEERKESVAAQGSSLEGAEMGSSCRCRWGLLWLESFQTPYQPIRPQKELWLGRPSRYSAGYPPSLISSPTSFVESDDGVGEEAMGWDGGRFYVQNHSLSVCGDSRWWFFIKTFLLILSFL